MTLAQVADAIGASRSHLSNIENGLNVLMPAAAEAIAKLFGITSQMLREAKPDEQVSDEAELLTLFRGASPEQRQAILKTVRILVSLGAKSDEG